MGLGAAVIGAGALGAAATGASAVIGSNAASNAAQTQANAANQASANQMQMFNTVKQLLNPWTAGGGGSEIALQNFTGTNSNEDPSTAPLTKMFNPTMADLAKTPGYQFTLDQGTKATQNSYAAQGLGASGAALKGAANYAEGLAGTTYQQQFQNYLSQNQQVYNMLYNQSALGENAAAMTGNAGVQSQTTANQLLTSGAAASAAGTIGSASQIGAGLSGVGSGLGNSALLYALNQSGMFGGGSGGGGGGSNAWAGDNVTGTAAGMMGAA